MGNTAFNRSVFVLALHADGAQTICPHLLSFRHPSQYVGILLLLAPDINLFTLTFKNTIINEVLEQNNHIAQIKSLNPRNAIIIKLIVSNIFCCGKL